jgi:hypothetical protein
MIPESLILNPAGDAACKHTYNKTYDVTIASKKEERKGKKRGEKKRTGDVYLRFFFFFF